MSSTEVTPGEVEIIKLGEKILVPVVGTLTVISIGTIFQMYQAVAQIETKMEADDKREVENRIEQGAAREDLTEMKLQLNGLQTHYEHIVEDVDEIKEQNTKILEILTSSGVH